MKTRGVLVLVFYTVVVWLPAEEFDLLSLQDIDALYERADQERKAGNLPQYAAALEVIAFESVASPAPEVLHRADQEILASGIDSAVDRVALPTTSATDALSLLGEYRLQHDDPIAARPLLSLATIQRATTLLQALRAEAIAFSYSTLPDALLAARNVRNTFKYLGELDVEEDPNLFRDLFNLGLALAATGHQEPARRAYWIVSGESSAGRYQSAAVEALEEGGR